MQFFILSGAIIYFNLLTEQSHIQFKFIVIEEWLDYLIQPLQTIASLPHYGISFRVFSFLRSDGRKCPLFFKTLKLLIFLIIYLFLVQPLTQISRGKSSTPILSKIIILSYWYRCSRTDFVLCCFLFFYFYSFISILQFLCVCELQ